jgi:hypothetical protein
MKHLQAAAELQTVQNINELPNTCARHQTVNARSASQAFISTAYNGLSCVMHRQGAQQPLPSVSILPTCRCCWAELRGVLLPPWRTSAVSLAGLRTRSCFGAHPCALRHLGDTSRSQSSVPRHGRGLGGGQGSQAAAAQPRQHQQSRPWWASWARHVSTGPRDQHAHTQEYTHANMHACTDMRHACSSCWLCMQAVSAVRGD